MNLNNDETDSKKETASTALILYVKNNGVTLFHDVEGKPYAVIPQNDIQRIVPIRARAFRQWLTQQYYNDTGKAAGSEAISSALNVVEAMACFDGNEYELNNRICWHDNAIWYDVGDWRAVKITTNSFEIVQKPPILFKKYTHQKPLSISK